MDLFGPWMNRWRLQADGAVIRTNTSDLLPVLSNGQRAMLKVARHPEEQRGAGLMLWYDGDGAATVLAHEEPALLLERLDRADALAAMANGGRDEEATGILCEVAARLHGPRGAPPSTLVPLELWFASLQTAAARGGMFASAFGVARGLLDQPQDVLPLHGDLHHGNVLHSEGRGWLAVDPKGLIGERGFDFANIFHNPDAGVATAPGRMNRLLVQISATARLSHQRLLHWVFAYSALSAAWLIEDGQDPAPALAIGRLAAVELGLPAS